jgi:hypothetical protein
MITRFIVVSGASRAALLAGLLAGISLPAASALAADANLGAPVDFPVAGIRIAFPRGQDPAPSFKPAILANRIERDGNDWKSLATLIAIPIVDANLFPGAEKLARTIIDEQVRQQGNVIADAVSSAEVRVQDRAGWRHVALLRDADKKQEVHVTTTWTAAPEANRLAFCFAVVYRHRGADANGAAAVAAAICSSAVSIPVVAASDLDEIRPGVMIESGEHGFAIRVPDGWHIIQAGARKGGLYKFSAGVMDYVTGASLPSVNMVIAPAGEANAPAMDEAQARQLSQDVKRMLSATEFTPLVHREAKLGGRPAVECAAVMRIGAADVALAARRAYAGGQACTVIMTVLGKDEKKALRLLDKVVAEFRIMESAPATRGTTASAPGTEPIKDDGSHHGR